MNSFAELNRARSFCRFVPFSFSNANKCPEPKRNAGDSAAFSFRYSDFVSMAMGGFLSLAKGRSALFGCGNLWNHLIRNWSRAAFYSLCLCFIWRKGFQEGFARGMLEVGRYESYGRQIGFIHHRKYLDAISNGARESPFSCSRYLYRHSMANTMVELALP